MKADYPKFAVSFLVMIVLVWTISCSGRSGNTTEALKETKAAVAEDERYALKISSPEENAEFRLKEPVKVVLSVGGRNMPDSIIVSFDGKKVASLRSAPWEMTIPADYTAKTGRKSLKATAFLSGGQPKSATHFLVVYSDVVPEQYGYRVVHTYPHDREAFTQGLFFFSGVLYEGTGQESGSSLREVDLESGKVLKQHNLDASLFGEGITLYGDRIYQVTWENKVGFVYDRETFKLINKLYYPTQGWGLTTMNDRIVMSDGTNVLYFYEPENFTVVSRLEVYDNRNKVDSLNELEYINGEIWANIWMSDSIARIDPATGKVKGYIDLKGLLPEKDRNQETDVLNGIAYDQQNNRLFVTGKKWPKLFEIKVIQ